MGLASFDVVSSQEALAVIMLERPGDEAVHTAH